VDGFILAAFARPSAALRWALAVHTDMLKAPWPNALLKHALAEEVCVPYMDNLGRSGTKVVFRGPRIKVRHPLHARMCTCMRMPQLPCTCGMLFRQRFLLCAVSVRAL
jgi:hypothetical protein